jgi:hypothetical protein
LVEDDHVYADENRQIAGIGIALFHNFFGSFLALEEVIGLDGFGAHTLNETEE